MKFGYTLVYVQDVACSVDFYEEAFGLKRRSVHEAGLYAEMETGATTLAFVACELARLHVPGGFHRNSPREVPAGFAISLIMPDVGAAYERALDAGASSLSPPEVKPWGLTCAYVRDRDGITVQLCSESSAPHGH